MNIELPLPRRDFLTTVAAATAGVVACRVGGAEEKAAQPFRHRGYLGWITDLASRGEPNVAWPSMRLDEDLLADYADSLDALARVGFNEIVVWGFYVSGAWPVDVESAVSPERGRLVERLIKLARAKNIKVLSGLGVYSWGFETIIKAHPQLAPNNPKAMCLAHPESWKWMQRVVDYVFTRFDLDGVSMQSADQGRCRCEECRKISDGEYHAQLNIRTADYIRSRWPGKVVGVSSWGMNFGDPANAEAIIRMSRSLDYLVDFNNSSARGGPDQRRKLIASLGCDFGTLGGPQPEPPQHWDRDRWFLPTLRRTGEHVRKLAADGGRACEFFYHIRANPGDAVSLSLAGRTLADPAESWESQAQSAVAEVFDVDRAGPGDAILALLLDAEEAYFRYLGEFCGTVSLEPLVSDRPGAPVYLTRRLKKEQLAEYGRAVGNLVSRAEKITLELPRNRKVATTLECLRNVAKEAIALQEPGRPAGAPNG